MNPDPDDRPSAADLIEMPPERVTLHWCGSCAVLYNTGTHTCRSCQRDTSAITYEWVEDE